MEHCFLVLETLLILQYSDFLSKSAIPKNPPSPFPKEWIENSSGWGLKGQENFKEKYEAKLELTEGYRSFLGENPVGEGLWIFCATTQHDFPLPFHVIFFVEKRPCVLSHPVRT